MDSIDNKDIVVSSLSDLIFTALGGRYVNAKDLEKKQNIDNDKKNNSYNKTQKEKHLSAGAALAIKLRQEKKLNAKLHPHFKSVAKNVKSHYAANGELPSFEDHQKKVKTIINDHYIDTATIFASTIRINFQPLIDDDDEAVQALLDSKIENDADERSDFSADSIASTTESNFKDYIKEAIAVAAAADILLSDNEIADNISSKFDDTSEGRIDLISVTETGTAANSGGSDELDVMNDVDAEFEDETSISDYEQKKTWVAILDDVTREWHADADGQEVNIDEPFEVNDEELMEPLDDSLGATGSNICNCRCSSVISLGLNEG